MRRSGDLKHTQQYEKTLYVKSLHSTEDDVLVGRVAKGNQANKNLP